MLSDRKFTKCNNLNNNNNNNNNNSNTKNCDISGSMLYDDLKNKIQMDAINNGDLSISSINISNSSVGIHKKVNAIKRERLSPPANGDAQSSMSRSRSATPSSYPETPPQSLHLNDIVGQNLSTNLLSSLHTRPNEFQARNYSDFMRNLAAKYNNNDSNDPIQRSLFFDQKLVMAKLGTKESPSPPDVKRPLQNATTSQQIANMPFVSSLFCNLQFSPVVFPPLIDMSSTQALITLARAAKEAEIQNILKSSPSKRPFTGQASSSPSTSDLTHITQSTVDNRTFPAQPCPLPSGFQGITSIRQLHAQSLANETNSAATEQVYTSPLDLSSTPQAKRLKTKSTTVPTRSSCSRVQTPTSVQHKPEPVKSNFSPETTTSICQAQSDEVNSWSVDDVCDFVSKIELCAEYTQIFREQQIDGTGLPLLTEDHLTNSLGMKLGPALKLRSILAKKLGGPCPCVSCTAASQRTNLPAASITSSSISSTSSLSGFGCTNIVNNTVAHEANQTTNSSLINLTNIE